MKLSRGTISPQTPLEWAMINTQHGYCLVVRIKGSNAICALYFGESRSELLAKLPWKNVPKIGKTTAPLSITLELIKAFRGDPSDLEVVLDVTEFRFEVLEVLTQKVGFGQVVTYSELARLCGRESAVRAVASALACNPVAGLVPCHRVVPKAGGVGQYRWGTELKSKMQNYEKSIKR